MRRWETNLAPLHAASGHGLVSGDLCLPEIAPRPFPCFALAARASDARSGLAERPVHRGARVGPHATGNAQDGRAWTELRVEAELSSCVFFLGFCFDIMHLSLWSVLGEDLRYAENLRSWSVREAAMGKITQPKLPSELSKNHSKWLRSACQPGAGLHPQGSLSIAFRERVDPV